MSIERIVFAMAGIFIIATVLLAQYHDPRWLYATLFIGANLLQSAFTGFCPLALILKAMGRKSGAAFG